MLKKVTNKYTSFKGNVIHKKMLKYNLHKTTFHFHTTKINQMINTKNKFKGNMICPQIIEIKYSQTNFSLTYTHIFHLNTKADSSET